MGISCAGAVRWALSLVGPVARLCSTRAQASETDAAVVATARTTFHSDGGGHEGGDLPLAQAHPGCSGFQTPLAAVARA
jgi:hypothetical protein